MDLFLRDSTIESVIENPSTVRTRDPSGSLVVSQDLIGKALLFQCDFFAP